MADEIKGLFTEDPILSGGINQAPQPVDQDEYNAIRNAVGPSAANPFATVIQTIQDFRVHQTLAAPSNASHHVVGVQVQASTGQVISGVSSPTVTNMNRFNLMVGVSSIVTPGTLRITGTSYNPATGITTPADTEDIVIGAGLTGYYMSLKLWTGTITVSSVGGLSVVANFYRHSYQGFDLPASDLVGFDFSCTAQSSSNSIQVEIFHFDKSARTNTKILDVTDTNFSNVGGADHYRRTFSSGTYTIDYDDGDAMYVRITTNNVRDVQFTASLRSLT